jgi:hypothetical protein
MINTELEAKVLPNTFLNLPVIRSLVREKLGCRCPESVFDDILVGYPALFEQISNELGEVQILVGKRLLISIVVTSHERLTEGIVERCIKKGKAIRDTRGFNKFRLVLTGEPSEYPIDDWSKRFCKDDCLHLHVIPKSTLFSGL